MANKFNLSARLTLEGPFGIKPVVDKINKSLKDVNVRVNVDINQQSVKALNDLNKTSASLRAEFKLLNAETKLVNANIRSLASSINSISTASSGLSRKFGNSAKTVSSDIRKIGTEFGKLSKQSQVLNKLEFGKTLPGNLDKISTGLGNVETGLRNISLVAQPVAASLDTVNKSIKGASSSSKKFGNAQARTNAVIAATGRGAAEAASEIEDFGRISGLALRRFAAFSIATSLVFGFFNAVTSAVSASITFERELIKISQVTGTSVVGLKSLTDTVDNLAVSLGVSSSELLDSSRTLSQAGFTANQVRQSLEAIAKTDLSPTFNNIAETTEGAIAAVRQFNLEVTDLDSALGSINAVSAKFAVESSDIIGAIQRAGGVFASTQNNIVDSSESLRQFIALFTSVRATTRESAETIAVALRTIFTRIQRRGTIDALRELNIELLDSQGKFVGAFEAIKRLSEGLGGLDTRDQRFASITEDVAGVRQIGKFIPLIQQFATAQEALKVAQDGTDSTSKNAEQALESLGNQIDRTGEKFLKLIRDLTETDTFQSLARSILFVADSLIDTASAVKPILPILGLLATFQAAKAIPTFTRGLFKSNPLGGGGQDVTKEVSKTAAKETRIQDASTKAQLEVVAALQENTAAVKGDTATAKTPSRIEQLRAKRDFEGVGSSDIQGRARTASQRAMLVRAGQNLSQQGANPEAVGAAMGVMIRELEKGSSEFRAFTLATQAATDEQRKKLPGAQFFANPALAGSQFGGGTGSNLDIGAIADAALRDRSPRRGIDVNKVGEDLVSSLVKDGATEQEVTAAVKSLVRAINSGATEIEATARATETANKVRARATNREIISITGNKNAPGDTAALAQRLLASEGVASRVQAGIRSGNIMTDADRLRASQEAFGKTTPVTSPEQLGLVDIKGDLLRRRASVQALIAAEQTYTQQLKSGATQQQARIAAMQAGTLAEKQLTQAKKKARFQGLTSNIGTVGLFAGPVAGSIVNRFGGGSPEASGASGGISGAITGGFTGGMVGGVPGAVIGTAIGGIAGFTTALQDAKKELARNDLSKSIDDLATKFNKLSNGTLPDNININESLNKALQDVIKRSDQVKDEFLAPGIGDFFAGLDPTKIFRADDTLDRINKSIEKEIEAGGLQSEVAKPAADILLDDIRRRLEQGDRGNDLFKGLDREKTFQLIGRGDRETAELAALEKNEQKRIDIYVQGGQKLVLEAKKQDDAVKAVRKRISELTSDIDLFAMNLDGLSRAAQFATTNGALIRAQIESISNGFASISQFNLRDISGNLDQVGRPELDQRLGLVDSAVGGSPELTKAVNDLRFLSTEGVGLLAEAAGRGDIEGDSAEVLVNRIFNEGGFSGLSPIVQKAFEKRINEVFGGKLGSDTSLAEILEQDPKFVEGIVGDLGNAIKSAVNESSKIIVSSANEFAQGLNTITQKQLQIGQLQDSTISRLQDTRTRISEFRGNIPTGTQGRAERNALVGAATTRGGLGGTTDVRVIGAEIKRLNEATRQAETDRQNAQSPEEIAKLNSEIATNNRKNTELRGALDTLAKDVRELSNIEKQLAEVQRRRQAGRGLAQTLIGAQLDPQALTQLTQGISGIQGIISGGPLTAQTFSAGTQLADQLAAVLPAAQAKAFRDFIAEQNIQRIAQGNPQLAQQLRDAEGQDQESKLLSQYEKASINQIEAIKVQAGILRDEITWLTDTNDKLLSEQLTELRNIYDAIKGNDIDPERQKREEEEFKQRRQIRDNQRRQQAEVEDNIVVPEANEQRGKTFEEMAEEERLDVEAQARRKRFENRERAERISGMRSRMDMRNQTREDGGFTGFFKKEQGRELDREGISDEKMTQMEINRARTARLNAQRKRMNEREEERGSLFADAIREFEEERRNRPQRFTGGLINGGFSKSRSDNKVASVQGGEFVVNRLATRDNRAILEAINAGQNVGFVNGGQIGGAGRRNSSGSMGNPQFMNAMNAFSSSASQLSKSLNNISVISNQLNRVSEQLRNVMIPERIQIESAPIQVNVVFNGVEMFTEMKPEIQKIVQDKIKRALSDAINPITGETNTRFN